MGNCRRTVSAVVVILATVMWSGCDLLDISNPNIVEGDAIDPATDAPTLSMSAQQDLAAALGRHVMMGSYFTGSSWTANINAPENLVASHRVERTLGLLENDLFGPESRARTAAIELIDAIEGTEVATSVHTARAEMVAGYAFQLMAEFMCRGAVDGGPALATGQMLDSAVVHFNRAVDIGQQVGSGEAAEIANAARVGRARAHLQAGRDQQAIESANAVPDGFSYALQFADDIANRDRLSNYVAIRTYSQTTISVAPPYRQLDDPRVPVIPPSEHALVPMDGQTEIWAQGKYNYGTAIRLASKLEARYIAAEAQGTSAMRDLIDERRAAAGQDPYDGSTSEDSITAEFLEQKTRDFFMEGQRMGDYRRHPDVMRYVPETGEPYRKEGFQPVGDQVCFPLPISEISNNPNIEL